MKKGHFRLTCVAQKRCCLSSLLYHSKPWQVYRILATLSSDMDGFSKQVHVKVQNLEEGSIHLIIHTDVAEEHGP